MAFAANLKRLSDVSVGQVIKIGGNKYKLSSSAPFGYLLKKEILPGIFADKQVDVSSVVSDYNGAFNTLVEVIEVGTAPKTDLTSQLRQQQAKQSLAESLRIQKAAQEAYDEEEDFDDEDEYDDEEEEDEPVTYGYGQVDAGYRGPLTFGYNPHAHSDFSAYDAPGQVHFNGNAPEIQEAKASALSANLKAQQASQSAISAKFDAVLAKNKAKAVEEQVSQVRSGVNSLGYEFGGLEDRVGDIAHEIESVADVAYDAQDAAYEAINRVAAIENKQKLEEEKMSLQNELNRKLAAQKQQNQLQAQLNQKLNQKTTGGNGTMKKLFGAAFNFGKVEGKFAFSPITGGLALRKGISNDFVAYNKDTKELTDVSGLTLKFDVPAFKLPTSADQVVVGDYIIHNGEFVAVTKKNDGYLEVINPEKGVNGSVIPTKNALLGAAFYTVVKTLDAAGQGGFNPMLLMALGKGNKEELLPLLLMSGGLGNGTTGAIDPTLLMLLGDDVEDLLPLVLMQQGGVTGQGFNPLFFLLSKKGKGKDLLPLLLASGGLNGGQAGQMNPMMMMALAGDGDIDPMTLALMSGGFGGQGAQAGAMNPAMLMLLQGDGGSDMKDLFMMQALTGQNIFGGAAPVAPAAKEVKKDK